MKILIVSVIGLAGLGLVGLLSLLANEPQPRIQKGAGPPVANVAIPATLSPSPLQPQPSSIPRGYIGVRYSGGNGRSVANAIRISGATGDKQGREAELAYVRENFPIGSVTNRLRLQAADTGILYDVLHVKTHAEFFTLYFDISEFAAK